MTTAEAGPPRRVESGAERSSTLFGVGRPVAAPLVAIASILHDELYRKRFLPTVTDDELERLSREALHEKQSLTSEEHPRHRNFAISLRIAPPLEYNTREIRSP